jgi:hypothetical protein
MHVARGAAAAGTGPALREIVMGPAHGSESVLPTEMFMAETWQLRTSQVWAVVQTGFITPSSDIVSFVDEDGNKCPQVIRLVKNERQANQIKTRLSSVASKVQSFGKIKAVKSTPLYGFVQLTVDGAKKVRTMTDEQKKAAGERLKAARKGGKK